MAMHRLEYREKVLRRFAATWTNPNSKQLEILDALTDAYDRFMAEGLADTAFNVELLGINVEYEKRNARFAQRVGEINLAEALRREGFTLSSADAGPDLLAVKNQQRVWFELITPEPKEIPPNWFKHGVGQSFPHEAILLRYTAAIAEKANKGLGYLLEGIMQPNEPYVIVVNDALLNRNEGYLHSISGKPFVMEATMALGPRQIMIDRQTREVRERGFAHRPEVDKAKVLDRAADPVPSNTFVSGAYPHVSAVVGTSLRMRNVLDQHWPSVMMHNLKPLAPLPCGLLPVDEAWDCCDMDEEGYTLKRIA
jgi:hypothetical protein